MKKPGFPDLTRVFATAASVTFCLAAIPDVAWSQEDPALTISPEKRAAVEELIEILGLEDLILLAMEETLPAQKLAMPHIPDIFWEEFQARIRADIDDFVELVVPIYSKPFTQSEIQGLIKFYQTPLGQRLIQAQPTILAESTRAGQEWGAKVGYRVELDLVERGIRIKQP